MTWLRAEDCQSADADTSGPDDPENAESVGAARERSPIRGGGPDGGGGNETSAERHSVG